jgi:hypothetical protein
MTTPTLTARALVWADWATINGRTDLADVLRGLVRVIDERNGR